MSQVCAHCGTEVDADALFCPTCGQPIEANSEPQLPPAPDWPGTPAASGASQAAPPAAPAPGAWTSSGPDEETGTEPAWSAGDASLPVEAEVAPAPAAPAETAAAAPAEDAEPIAAARPPLPPWRRGVAARNTPLPSRDELDEAAEPTPVPAEPVPSWRATPPPPAPLPAAPVAAASPPAAPRGVNRPPGIVVAPEMLSGWLAVTGAALGIIALFLPWRSGGTYTAAWGLASGINVVIGIVLLVVLAVILAPHLVPRVPRRDLAVAAVGLVGVGIGLDRFGLPLTGAGAIVFLIGMLAVAAGGLIAELGFDRRTGGPQR